MAHEFTDPSDQITTKTILCLAVEMPSLASPFFAVRCGHDVTCSLTNRNAAPMGAREWRSARAPCPQRRSAKLSNEEHSRVNLGSECPVERLLWVKSELVSVSALTLTVIYMCLCTDCYLGNVSILQILSWIVLFLHCFRKKETFCDSCSKSMIMGYVVIRFYWR